MSSSQVNILLVDDKYANIVALRAILERSDYNILSATSGEEALRVLLRVDVALVLLDVKMPGMDGFELASLMKDASRTKFIPIIFVTATAKDIKDVYRGYSVGGVDYILKPLDPDVVRAKVSIFVDLFLQKREIMRQAEIIRNSERAQFLEREQAARIRAEAAERRYYDLINWVDHAVLWEYDPIASRFLFVSGRSSQILGYTPEQWKGDGNFLVNHTVPEDKGLFIDMFNEVIFKGQDGRCEHRFYRSDGEMIWVHSGVTPRKDSSGNVTLLWGLTLDITDFKTSELNQRFLAQASAVLSSSLDYGVILNKVAKLIVNVLADMCIIDILDERGTPQRVAAFPASKEQQPLTEVLKTKAPIRRDRKSPLRYAIETGKPVLVHTINIENLEAIAQDEEHLKTLQKLKLQSLLIVPMNVRGKILGIVSLASLSPHHRFTERDRKFVEELASHMALSVDNAYLYAEAKKAVKLREEVLGIVSHDLRSPLSSIVLNSQLLLRKGIPQIVPQSERILRSAAQMTRLTEDLLDMAKIDAGQLTLTKGLNSASDLVKNAVESVVLSAESKAISLRKEIPGTPVEIICDYTRILQVLVNLLRNAIKFSSEHGSIGIGYRTENNRVVFWVSDNGQGIAREYFRTIFERFGQTPEGKTKKEGVGLGLFIAKQMVEAHSGHIWVESEVGRGSTFYVSIPTSIETELQKAG